MNSLLLCFIAAGFASISNLFFRISSQRSQQESTNNNYYLLFFYLTAFSVSILLYFFRGRVPFDPIALGIGCLVGALNMFMMRLTAQALRSGPAGLTFAFQNASAVFPGIILFSIFGTSFGFQITLFQIIGMGIIICGLFLGSTKNQKASSASLLWLKYAVGCFLVQIIALTIIHWRCLLFANGIPDHPLIPWNLDEGSDAWFMPGQFGTALILQLGRVAMKRKRLSTSSEAGYGCLGGLATVTASLCLLLSTKAALPIERGLIFPCFAAAVMILCNIWANRIYRERFDIAANGYCTTGIFLAVH